MRTIQWIFTAICLCVSCIANAQAPTNSQKIAEVYGTYLNDKPELLAQFNRLLDERVEYLLAPQQDGEKYPYLSQMPLQNKLNASLVADPVFDKDTFNPLRYSLEFFSKVEQIYRIDGTEYLLVIKPQ